MRLAVKTYPDCNVYVPGAPKVIGSPASYVGREFNYETKTYDLKDDPDYFESSTKEGRQIKKAVIQGSLFPADKETADYCGVYFYS